MQRAAAAVQTFRRAYGQVEATLEFLGNAVNSRTSAPLRYALQSLDRLAAQSIVPVLSAAGVPTPPVATYVDQGMGASILRAGIRLWAPGTVNPVAAIKIVRHNLYRPTSLFHETGHRVAHLTNWVPSMRASLSSLGTTRDGRLVAGSLSEPVGGLRRWRPQAPRAGCAEGAGGAAEPSLSRIWGGPPPRRGRPTGWRALTDGLRPP